MKLFNFSKPWYDLSLEERYEKLQNEVSASDLLEFLSSCDDRTKKSAIIQDCPDLLLEQFLSVVEEKSQKDLLDFVSQKFLNDLEPLSYDEIRQEKLHSLKGDWLIKLAYQSNDKKLQKYIIEDLLSQEEWVSLLLLAKDDSELSNRVLCLFSQDDLEVLSTKLSDKPLLSKIKKRLNILEEEYHQTDEYKNRVSISQALQVLRGFSALKVKWQEIESIYLIKVAQFNQYKSFASESQKEEFTSLFIKLDEPYQEYLKDKILKEEEQRQKDELESRCLEIISILEEETSNDIQEVIKLADEKWQKLIEQESVEEKFLKKFEVAKKTLISTHKKLDKQEKLIEKNKDILAKIEEDLTSLKESFVNKKLTFEIYLKKVEKNQSLLNSKKKFFEKDCPLEFERINKWLKEFEEEKEKGQEKAKQLEEQFLSLLDEAKEQEASKKTKNLADNLADSFALLSTKQQQHHQSKYSKVKSKLLGKYFSSVEEREWEEFNNLELKEKLITQVSDLGKVDDLAQVSREVRLAQKKWKEIGAVPYKESQEIWDKFQKITQEQYARCESFLEEEKKENKVLFAEKEEMCLRVETLCNDLITRDIVREIKGIQARWKEIDKQYRVAKLWNRFKKACDLFFEKKNALSEINVEVQKKLLERAKNYASTGNLDSDLSFIKGLQKQWHDVSVVDYSHFYLAKDFREICDGFYNQKKSEVEEKNARFNTLLDNRKLWLNSLSLISVKYNSVIFRRWLGYYLKKIWGSFDNLSFHQLKGLEEEYKKVESSFLEGQCLLDSFSFDNSFSKDFVSVVSLPTLEEVGFLVDKIDVKELKKDMEELSLEDIEYLRSDKDSVDFLSLQLKSSFGNSKKNFISYEEADENFCILAIAYYYLSQQTDLKSFEENAKVYLNKRQKLSSKDAL